MLVALRCLEASFISKDTHFCTVCELSCLHHLSHCKSSVQISKGAIYLYTGIHFYGFLQPTLSPLVFLILNWEKELILYSFQVFSTIFWASTCTGRVQGIYAKVHVQLWWGQGGTNTAALLPVTHPSSCAEGFVLFSSCFGIIAYEEEPFQWQAQTQTPGALQRLKASRGCCRSPAATLHWHDGMTGCMSPVPSSPPTSFSVQLPHPCLFPCVGYF